MKRNYQSIKIEDQVYVENEETIDRSAKIFLIRQCQQYLPPIDRLILMYIFDLNYAEADIATKLKTSRIFVNKRKIMALKRLRIIYDDLIHDRLKKHYYRFTKLSQRGKILLKRGLLCKEEE